MNSLTNCNIETQCDRQPYSTPALCFCLRCIIHLCANLDELSQTLVWHQRNETQKGDKQRGEEKEVTMRECQGKLKERGRMEAPEQKNEGARCRKPGAGMAESLSCKTFKMGCCFFFF